QGLPAALLFLICFLSAFFCTKTLKLRQAERHNKKSRDDSAELEKIMRLRNRELEDNLQYELHINTLRERNRIAREIHDNVGHLLSRSLLQTGALSAICPKEQTALKSGLEDLKDSLNSAMNSIRESVHGIRDDSLDLKEEARKIILPLREGFITEFDYDISGEIPPKIKLCFISVLKEAVSNIIRHSSGDKVSVIFREHPSMYQLIVNDNGKPQAAKSTEGMGLADMEERARAAGGSFNVSREKGFTVFVSVRKEGL
ncbi:MAG: histidine kinase, partial [[Eubacterium] siraeum]|nr:histidine kinase [[Eubacterium] siraeum]